MLSFLGRSMARMGAMATGVARRGGKSGAAALLPCVLIALASACGSRNQEDTSLDQSAASAIAFVQVNSAVPQGSPSTVSVPFTGAQSAGDLNVVVVGWNDTTAQVKSVTDSMGNTYQLAVGPTQVAGTLSESIYYAKNVVAAAAGANTVTVGFNTGASFPDIRIVEYAGIDPVNPVDVVKAATGRSSTSNSGTVTTTNAADLLVGANMVVTSTSAAGSGYTLRVKTNPDGDIEEDRVVSATGSYSATASLSGGGAWVMQLVAFRGAGGAADAGTDGGAGSDASGDAGGADAAAGDSGVADAGTDGSSSDATVQDAASDGAGSDATVQDAGADVVAEAATDAGGGGGSDATVDSGAGDAAADAGPDASGADAGSADSGGADASVATPTFVQGNSAVPSSATTLTVPYTAAQLAGDLNVVIVGWNSGASEVTSVTDSKGNAYALAAGPTVVQGTLSQSIYYAKNVAAAAANGNSVTITFNTSVPFPDVRILEYGGIDTAAPLDVSAVATGNSTSTSSGSVATRNAADLLVGADITTGVTTGAGSGYTTRLLTSDGDLAEDRAVTTTGTYAATAPLGGPDNWIMQLVAFRAAGSPPPPPPDTTPPAVSVASPGAGATLTGTATVTVSVSDPGDTVLNAQLVVDGALVGLPSFSGPPYTFSVDTTRFANGAHTVGAVAVDQARNAGSAAPVSVTFSNATAGNPAQTGLWSGTTALPIVSVNMALLSNQKILMYDGQSFGFDARVWDPVANTFLSVPAPANLFCSGIEQLADGRVVVIGGHAGAHTGLTAVNAFDPNFNAWTVLADMANPRWYPTATMLPDGRLLALSGESNCDGCDIKIPEIYSPATNSWTSLSSAQFLFSYYPHVHVLPDSRILVSSTVEDPTASQVLDLTVPSWTAVGGAAVDGGTAVMYLPGKILKSGTSEDPDTAVRSAFPTAYVLDMTQGSPTWRQVASMSFARTYHQMTMLPDGNVLVTGGGPTTAATDTANAILAAESWSPVTETWTTLAAMTAPRLYHSEALLLPDGRVLVAGGGRFDDTTLPTDQFSAEYFSPPYLFKGPRPVIASAPTTLQYGQAFTVQTPDAARIGRVSLIRFGAVTHNDNMGQRFVPLSFAAGTNQLTVTAPANGTAATPGYYMLFIVDTSGIPSVAAIVHF